jgi:hypothetical protein
MKSLLTLIAGLCTAHMVNAADCEHPITAPAAPTNPLYSCDLNFQAVGEGMKVIAGEYTLEGEGVITCAGQSGLTEEMPVRITMNAAPISLNVAIGQIEVEGNASNVALYTLTPEALIGEYGITQANLAIGAGFGMLTGTKLDASDVVLPMSMKLIKGLGFDFGITSMTIEHMTK